MAVLAVTYTLANGQTPDASLWNTNYSDIVTWANNRYNGSDTWSFMKVSSTNSNPVDIVSTASQTELSIDNTATDGDPVLTWNLSGSQKFILGVDDSDSDALILGSTSSLGTGNIMKIDSNITIYQDFLYADATVGTQTIRNSNTDNSGATSSALNEIIVGGSSAGDPYQVFTVAGVTSFAIGIDNSTSDTFKLSRSTALGTSDLLEFTSGNMNFSVDIIATTDGTKNIGGASGYIGDLSYKTLTDRGCLGWFDDGVEMQDGRIVSDCEAISSIQKHPSKKTVYGIPMLDYTTFPKVSYKQAEVNGVLLERDENDEPVGGADGVEMTSMQSIMIGCIKELHQRLKVIENARH